MNKLQNLYDITLEQNVVTLVVGAVYLSIALSLVMKTESCCYTLFFISITFISICGLKFFKVAASKNTGWGWKIGRHYWRQAEN